MRCRSRMADFPALAIEPPNPILSPDVRLPRTGRSRQRPTALLIASCLAPFCQFRLTQEKPCDIASRPRQAFHIAVPKRVEIGGDHNNGNRCARGDSGLQCGMCSVRDDDARARSYKVGCVAGQSSQILLDWAKVYDHVSAIVEPELVHLVDEGQIDL